MVCCGVLLFGWLIFVSDLLRRSSCCRFVGLFCWWLLLVVGVVMFGYYVLFLLGCVWLWVGSLIIFFLCGRVFLVLCFGCWLAGVVL